MYLKLTGFLILNIFIFKCSCCYRSVKSVFDVQIEEKYPKNFISDSLTQNDDCCFENETLKFYCYNNGKCLIKRVSFNNTHQNVVFYCECEHVIQI